MIRRAVAIIVVIVAELILLAIVFALLTFYWPEHLWVKLGVVIVGSIVGIIAFLDSLNGAIEFISTRLIPAEPSHDVPLSNPTDQTRGVTVGHDVGGSVATGDQSLIGNQIETLTINHYPEKPPTSNAISEQQIEDHLPTYHANLYQQVGFTRILGESTAKPLGEIFTDVYLLDKLTAENRFNIDTLWEQFVPRGWGWQKHERLAGLELVKTKKSLFILGKPGAGKTTFLKYIATQALDGKLPYLPLFITLHEWAKSGKSLLVFMADQLFEGGGTTAENYLKQKLKTGKWMMLCDGLDEVPAGEKKREEVVDAIVQLRRQFPNAPLLVTCRIAAESYRFEGFQYVEVADFTEEQVTAFVQRWFAKDEEMQRDCLRALLEEETHAYLKELAQTPLLLTLICVVYGKHNRFPIERGEIYNQATEALLVSWDSHRRIRRDEPYHELSLQRKKQMLAQLAAYFFDREQFFIPQKELIEQIERYFEQWVKDADGEAILRAMEAQHGLLVSRSVGIYSFSHLTLQEYYTACYIRDHEARGRLTELMKHVGEPRWRELFLLTAEMVSREANFADLYLQGMIPLAQQSQRVNHLLLWARGKETADGRSSPIRRLFYIFLALALDLARDLGAGLALDYLLWIMTAIAKRYSHLKQKQRQKVDAPLPQAFAQCLSWANELGDLATVTALQAIELPTFTHPKGAWQRCAKALEGCLQQRLNYDWKQQKWTEEDFELLKRYLRANQLLLECLKVMPPALRPEVEAKMFLV